MKSSKSIIMCPTRWRGLISKASHIIAILLPLWYETADSMLLDPYAGQMAGFLETLLHEKQYYVMICSFKAVEQVINLQRTWQMDGSVLVTPHDDNLTHDLVKRTNTPPVVIDRRFDDLPMLSVCLNDRMGNGDGTPYLIELTTTQSQWSTSIIRGSIDDVVIRGITVLSGKKPGFRIWSTDETATIDHVRINELGILGEKIKKWCLKTLW